MARNDTSLRLYPSRCIVNTYDRVRFGVFIFSDSVRRPCRQEIVGWQEMNTQRMIANMRRGLEINQRIVLTGRNSHPTEFRIEMSDETLLAIIAEAHTVRSSVPAIFGSTIVINDSLPFGDFNILKVMR